MKNFFLLKTGSCYIKKEKKSPETTSPATLVSLETLKDKVKTFQLKIGHNDKFQYDFDYK